MGKVLNVVELLSTLTLSDHLSLSYTKSFDKKLK